MTGNENVSKNIVIKIHRGYFDELLGRQEASNVIG